MASIAQPLPNSLTGLGWLGDFLKHELAPYNGRAELVARMVVASTLMMIIIMTISSGKGARLLKNPDIISRGFIYLKENQEMLDEIRKRIRGLMQRLPAGGEVESDYLKTLIRDQVGQFIYNKTRRRPMILPVVIEV